MSHAKSKEEKRKKRGENCIFCIFVAKKMSGLCTYGANCIRKCKKNKGTSQRMPPAFLGALKICEEYGLVEQDHRNEIDDRANPKEAAEEP